MNERTQAGFTLLEMIVVVAVLGLVAVLLLGRGPSRSAALDLRAASNEMAAFLRRARAEAIESDRDVSVSVSTDGRGYGTATRRPDDAGDGAGDGGSGGDADRSLPASVAVVRRADGRLPPPITFHPDGSATGGQVVLGEEGRQRTVTVDWFTGAVSAS